MQRKSFPVIVVLMGLIIFSTVPFAFAEGSGVFSFFPGEADSSSRLSAREKAADSSSGDEEELDIVFSPAEYQFSGKKQRSYDSETLKYSVESFEYHGAFCYLSKIWMQDPGKQIRKVTAAWKKNIVRPINLAQKLPETALAINGSGYVSPTYPWIPDEYPGTNSDYYYTPLGSITVTDGEVFRNLEGVPYSGLTLEADGLHMYVKEDNETVLASSPVQTWSFYEECPLIVEGRILIPEDWSFASAIARRTVIARINRNNYLVLTVTRDGSSGLTLWEVCDFFAENFYTEWVYNLDGGPSSALICRNQGSSKLTTVTGGSARDEDIMAFIELPDEQ